MQSVLIFLLMLRNEPKILILDDDPAITDLLSEILQHEGYKVLASNSPKDVLFLARQFRPDLLVLDIMMPEIDGYDVCEFFKKDPELKFTRIVVLSARNEKDARIKSYRVRADTFLGKPFEIDELREIIITNLLVKNTYDHIIAELQNQAMLDRVLNCYQRKYMEKRISEELKRMERSQYPVSLILFELDHFENVNIRYGFAFGNDVKKDVLEAVRHELREYDLIGRFDENSFVILLLDTGSEGLKSAAVRIHDVLSSMVFLQKKRLALDPTITILGVERGQKLEDVIPLLEEGIQRERARKQGKP
jgi:two-component system, cell cycle response regulator